MKYKLPIGIPCEDQNSELSHVGINDPRIKPEEQNPEIPLKNTFALKPKSIVFRIC